MTWRIGSGVVVAGLLLGWADAGWAQSNITLVAEADTTISENTPTTSKAFSLLEVRSRPVPDTGRQHIAYIRFDLGVLSNAPQAGIVFSVSRDASSMTHSNGDVHVYGLLDIDGNTTQDWGSGSTLTYDSSGLEVPGDGDATTQDLDVGRLALLGDLPESTNAGPETVTLSGAALDAFLLDRFDNGGLATLMLVSEADIDRELYFQNAESAAPSVLDLVGILKPEDPVDPPGPDDPIVLIPDADARLANDPNRGPTSNVGGSTVWEVRWHDAPRIRIGYLRYDISEIDPSRFATATISGTFTDSSRNGPGDGSGMWNVYGLNDDVVSNEVGRLGNDWPESAVHYANAAGVRNDAELGTFEILESETTWLGTISFDGVDEQPLPFSSNTTDLDLTEFLNADTDGLVTFLFMDVGQNGDEYRIDSKEGNAADGHGPTTLNFIPGTAVGGLRFTGIEADAGSPVVVTWQARANRLYGIERTTDSLSASNWVAVATNILGTSVNTYTGAAPTEASAMYRIRDEGEAPAVEYFFDGFEEGAPGWTVVTGATHQAGTDWELGTPSGGPGSAQEGANVYATNLGGNFAPNADISLLSPPVDLSAAPAATLSFGNFYDFDGLSDFGFVYIRDENGAEIAELADPVATYNNFVIVWTTANIDLPAAALGRTVRIEFRFVSDASVEFAGWYIDNVRVGD